MAKADINIAQSRGDAVVALLERAEIGPLPAFYGILYDYLAGVNSLDAVRAGTLVEGATRGGDAAGLLYDEFVRPYQPGDSLERVVARMVERLETLDALIVERREVSRTHARMLSAASAPLATPNVDRALMREWIGRLQQANEVARRANVRLTEELETARAELRQSQEELAHLSRESLVDPLTAVANRKGLDSALSHSIAAARDSGACLSIGVMDIDHFKQFNDLYGHQVGDAVLKLASRALLANVRQGDVVGRMGGDEFVVLLHDCSRDHVIDRAEAIRTAVLGSDLAPLLGPDILGSVTVSIGVATYREGDSIPALLDRADHCLLEAKSQGRNRVVGEDIQPMPLIARAG